MKKKKIITIWVVTIIIILSILAGLTKAGYMPNYLNIQALCSEKTQEDVNNNKIQLNNNNNNNQSENNKKNHPNFDVIDKKPVIYLYPTKKQDVKVKLDYKGKIIADYPKYDKKIKGWDVIAYPNGKIINKKDKQEYSYLFWEGKSKEKINWNLSEGFVVKGEDTKEFLQKTLSQIGLTPKEYNEFIVYWYPIMQQNKYNLIHFAGEKYTNNAPLTIIPKPDSILRVFMVYKPLKKPIKIKKQKIKHFERKGFTVVEWGGSE